MISLHDIGTDVMLEIVSYLDAVSITKLLITSRTLNALRNKVYDRIAPYKQCISWKHWNSGLIIATSKIHFPHIQYFIEQGADDMNSGMYEAARVGSSYLVNFFVERGACRWNRGLEKASLGGHKELVEYFISNGAANWKFGIIGSCEGGHRDLVDYFLEKRGLPMDDELVGVLIASSAVGGHLTLVKEFIKWYKYTGSSNCEIIFREAARYGHQDLIDFSLQNLPPFHLSTDNLSVYLDAAAYGAHEHLVEFLIQKGASNWRSALLAAFEGGHKQIINKIARNIYRVDWNDGLGIAARKGRRDLIDFCSAQGANDWNLAMAGAAESGNRDLVNLFIEKGADNWNEGLLGATACGHRNLIDFFVANGANKWNECMYVAAEKGYPSIVEFFSQKGAHNWTSCMLVSVFVGDLRLVKYFVEKGADWKEVTYQPKERKQEDIIEYFSALRDLNQTP